LGPFAKVTTHELLHLLLELRNVAQLAIQGDLLEILDASRQIVEPARCGVSGSLGYRADGNPLVRMISPLESLRTIEKVLLRWAFARKR
jgi:hypothetical protein